MNPRCAASQLRSFALLCTPTLVAIGDTIGASDSEKLTLRQGHHDNHETDQPYSRKTQKKRPPVISSGGKPFPSKARPRLCPREQPIQPVFEAQVYHGQNLRAGVCAQRG